MRRFEAFESEPISSRYRNGRDAVASWILLATTPSRQAALRHARTDYAGVPRPRLLSSAGRADHQAACHYLGMAKRSPPYIEEVGRYVARELDNPTAVIAVLAAMLTDPDAYDPSERQPSRTLLSYVHELVLTDRALQQYLADTESPITRELVDDKWAAVWPGARTSTIPATPYEYEICISFAGADRAVAKKIAEALASPPMERRVFYDEFDKVALWGQELFEYLHSVYSRRSAFCLILFSHAYRDRAWTRHELRAAQTRVLEERGPYVLPVAINEGAVPDEFATVGYWAFKPGDEQDIADAAEDKINAYLRMHYFPLEEIAEILQHDLVSAEIHEGFRQEIKERRASGDESTAQALTAVALIAAADAEKLDKRARAVVDLVLFAVGSVSAIFDDNDDLVLGGEKAVKRWTGSDGPLMFCWEGWKDRLESLQERFDALGNDVEDRDAE